MVDFEFLNDNFKLVTLESKNAIMKGCGFLQKHGRYIFPPHLIKAM